AEVLRRAVVVDLQKSAASLVDDGGGDHPRVRCAGIVTGGAEAAPVAVLVGGSAYARLVGSVAGIVIAPGDPVFRRHLVVEAAGVAVIRFARGSVVGKVIAESSRRAGQVGIGSEFQQTLRDRADSSGRNLVSREWRSGGGVGDRRQSGEIAGLDRGGGLGG